MHGQNINLTVCVRVCVSVTLSVNRPLNGFLQDADLRKDVPFWVLDDE